MLGVSTRLAPFGTTIFSEMTALALKHGAVNLAQGFPDFDGPEFARVSLADAVAQGHNQYGPMPGAPVLRRAIAADFAARAGVQTDPDREITVTCGCTEAIAAVMLGLINPGDEVVLFEPFYDSYRAAVAMAGGVARFVALRPPRSDGPGAFEFDEAELRAAFTPRTKMILVNTPHNPTGKVFTRAELQLIAELCVHHGVVAVADEVYEHLVFEPNLPHLHLASFEGMRKRTITLSSLGKTFSYTGWKIGWAIAPEGLTAGIRAAHQFLTFSPAHPMQHAAAALIPAGAPAIAELVALLRSNREFLAGVLREIGLRVFMPAGTYFIMADHSGLDRKNPKLAGLTAGDDRAFCRWLTEHVGVAAIPPSVFYDRPELGHHLARFAFVKKRATLEESARRLRSSFGIAG
jgi:L-glutamine---4-(methylsulfanyl)-2-oxobutanoate aminotransferase